MSSDENTPTPPAPTESLDETTRYRARVKWFNNRAGYGFSTVTSHDRKGEDIFVHHSGVQVENEQYKYLVQGEYVEFNLAETVNDNVMTRGNDYLYPNFYWEIKPHMTGTLQHQIKFYFWQLEALIHTEYALKKGLTGENAREGYIRLHRPELDAYLSLLTKVSDPLRGKKAIEASLQRKGLLLKVTSEIEQIAQLSSDPRLGAISLELESARKNLAALTLSGPTAATQGKHAEALYALELRDRKSVA